MSTKLIIVSLVALMLALYLRHLRKRTSCVQDKNKWYLDEDELRTYTGDLKGKINYLFWTGGLDSTFRLCQILIDRKEKVQPIYLLCRDLDSESPQIQRKNKKKEIKTMKNIRKALHKKYPHSRNLMLPTLYVYGIQKDLEISKDYQTLRQEYGHFASRTITQYERIARFSIHYGQSVEVGLERCGTGLDKATYDKRTLPGDECILRKDIDKPFKIFKNLKFPMAHLSKEEYLEISSRNGYFDILKLSWSCWYPRVDGNPCGKCQMCKKRILK